MNHVMSESFVFYPTWSLDICTDKIEDYVEKKYCSSEEGFVCATAGRIESKVRDIFKAASSSASIGQSSLIVRDLGEEGMLSNEYREIFQTLFANLTVYLNLAFPSEFQAKFEKIKESDVQSSLAKFQLHLSWNNNSLINKNIQDFSKRLEEDSKKQNMWFIRKH